MKHQISYRKGAGNALRIAMLAVLACVVVTMLVLAGLWSLPTVANAAEDNLTVLDESEKTPNGWKTSLNVVTWNYNGFDTTRNVFIAEPTVTLARNERVHFSILELRTQAAIIEDIPVVRATDAVYGTCYRVTDKATLDKLNRLDADTYRLVATVNETDTYEGLEARITFTIGKAQNTFTVTPRIKQWKYGLFNEEYNLPDGQAENGEVWFAVTNLSGERYYYNSKDGTNELKNLNAGEYLFVAQTESSKNYVSCSQTTVFEVEKAQNAFTVTPKIRPWKYNAFDEELNLPEGKAQFGITTLIVTDKEGKEWYNSATGLNELAAVVVGEYTLKVTGSGFVNYEACEQSVEFYIEKAPNAFEELPSIPTWRYSAYDAEQNKPTAKPKYGDVKIVIIDSDEDVIYDSESGLDKLGEQNVGTYTLKATVEESENYLSLDYQYDFEITPTPNEWVDGELPFIESWVTGKFTEENLPVANAKFGTVVTVITDADDNVLYDSSSDVNKLADLEPGTYYMTSHVNGTDNYYAMEYSRQFKVLEPVGLPWWVTLLIVIGALGVAALVIFILWKLGVFQILTNKLAMALIKRATIDATVAAVRANKRTNEANEHVSKVKAQERLDAAREAQRNSTPEEVATGMQERAKLTAQKASEMQQRADKMSILARRYASMPTEDTMEQFNGVLTEEEFVEQFGAKPEA